MFLLSARRQYYQFNNLMSALLSYKLIVYKSPKKLNQSILLTMSPSTNTRSRSTYSREILYIVPPNSTTSPYLSKSDLDNIHNYIKAMTDKHHSYMKALNEHISDIIEVLSDTSSKAYK